MTAGVDFVESKLRVFAAVQIPGQTNVPGPTDAPSPMVVVAAEGHPSLPVERRARPRSIIG